jgi:hypothetical protein
VGGLITLFTSTAECNWTSNGTALFASISNDPVCSASNCTFVEAKYNVMDRYEALLNATALDASCFLYEHSPIRFTTLSGMCAADTLQLRASLPEVVAPYEKCNSETCAKNYTAAAEVYYRMCRGKGGTPFRQSERSAFCQNFMMGMMTLFKESNVPFCFSAQCSVDALSDEELFENIQWTDRIAEDFFSCSYDYGDWEAVNSSSSTGGDKETSSGFSHVVADGIWQWTALVFIPIFLMTPGFSI